jgi:hypothetical protein
VTGNLVADGGFEAAGVPAWTLTGMRRVTYGTPLYPGAAAGPALGGASAFLAGNDVALGTASQIVDLRPWAPEIDTGGASAQLAGLLGGYLADADAGTLDLLFTDINQQPVGPTLAVTPVSAGDRGQATTLRRRSASGAVPALARYATVRIAATRATGTFADALFDEISLQLQVPARPGEPNTPVTPGTPATPGSPGTPGGPTLRPFAGVSVLSPVAKTDSLGRARVQVGCANRTVGRCSGVLTLTAVLVKGKQAERIGSISFTLGAGKRTTLKAKLTRRALTRLRRVAKTGLRAHLYASARDGQGLVRSITAPVRLRAPVRR